MAYTQKQLEVIRFTEEEDRKDAEAELEKREQQRRDLYAAEDAAKPKADPATLNLISPTTLTRMEREIGGKKITGLKVVGENGQLFSDQKPFLEATSVIKYVLRQDCFVPSSMMNEEAYLLEFVQRTKPRTPILEPPEKCVVRIRLDAKCQPPSPFMYINQATEDLLRREHGVGTEGLTNIRRSAIATVMQNKEILKQGEIVTTLLPTAQLAVLKGLTLEKGEYPDLPGPKRDRTFQFTTLQLCLPLMATEFYARHILSTALGYMVLKVFHFDPKDEKGTDWVFLFASLLQKSNTHLNLLLVLAKRATKGVHRSHQATMTRLMQSLDLKLAQHDATEDNNKQ